MRKLRPFLALAALALCPPARAQDFSAAVADAKGRVTLGGQPARAGAPLAAGDELAVEGGEAVLMFGAAKLRLGPGARLRVEEHSAGTTILTLQRGRLDAWARGAESRRMRVRAGAAVLLVRNAVFSAGLEGGKASVRLYEGELGVADAFGGGLILTRGQRVEVGELGLGPMGSLPPGESTPPAEPGVSLPRTARRPAPSADDEAPESLPALAGFLAPSPVQEVETAATECVETVSPSAPCP